MPESNPDDIDQLPEKDLRKLLRDSQARNVTLQREVAQRDGALAVHDAGLTHLNTTQRGALLFALGDKEVNADNLKAASKALGFPDAPAAPADGTPPATPASTPGSDGTNGTPPASDANGTPPASTPGSTPEFLDEMPGSEHPDPRVAINASIAGLTKSEFAGVMAQRGGTGGDGFSDALRKAPNKAAALRVISDMGANEGLILDSDLA